LAQAKKWSAKAGAKKFLLFINTFIENDGL
jgi:hypothetical protein